MQGRADGTRPDVPQKQDAAVVVSTHMSPGRSSIAAPAPPVLSVVDPNCSFDWDASFGADTSVSTLQAPARPISYTPATDVRAELDQQLFGAVPGASAAQPSVSSSAPSPSASSSRSSRGVHERRASLELSPTHLDERQAMETLMHRLEVHIEDIGLLLQRPPSTQGAETTRASVPYEVRETHRARSPLPAWEPQPTVQRPVRMDVRLLWEWHLPSLSLPIGRATRLHTELVEMAREIVQHALLYQMGCTFPTPAGYTVQPNLVLVRCPSSLLTKMYKLLRHESRVRALQRPAWLRAWFASHQRTQRDLAGVSITVPTVFTLPLSTPVMTMLELVVVAMQLVLCVLGMFVRIR